VTDWIVCSSPRRRYVNALAVLGAIAAAATGLTAVVKAQTLVVPKPKTHAPAPAASSQQNKPMKSCPAYGPGFVQVPGSDICVKVGGSVEGDVAVGH
jgi:hypothetical protein